MKDQYIPRNISVSVNFGAAIRAKGSISLKLHWVDMDTIGTAWVKGMALKCRSQDEHSTTRLGSLCGTMAASPLNSTCLN